MCYHQRLLCTMCFLLEVNRQAKPPNRYLIMGMFLQIHNKDMHTHIHTYFKKIHRDKNDLIIFKNISFDIRNYTSNAVYT